MINPEKYITYTLDDFILDEDFRKIVRNSGSTDQLKDLLKTLPDKQQEINLAIQIIKGLHVKKIQQPVMRKNELWQQILHTQREKVLFSYFKYAASLLLLLGLGSTVFYLSTPKSVEKEIITNINPSNNATLILADGKKVAISSKQSTIQYSADGSGITVNDSSLIAQSVPNNGLNQMIVPNGKRSNIILSDGTKVSLNSGSKLIFPPVFIGNTREVYLEGEGLFDVAKNNEKPFYVNTDAFKMKVYGTKFNVEAYQQDEDYSIVLIEGKVSVNSNNSLQSKETFLAPNQKASISKGQGIFEVTNVENTEVYTSWVDGYLIFTNEDVSNLLKRVSRYYNVTIETELPVNNEKIYGKLDLKENLERVLDGIAFISKTKYEKRKYKYVFIND